MAAAPEKYRSNRPIRTRDLDRAAAGGSSGNSAALGLGVVWAADDPVARTGDAGDGWFVFAIAGENVAGVAAADQEIVSNRILADESAVPVVGAVESQ